MPRSLEGQIKATYFSLRVTLAVLAFTLPPSLYRRTPPRAYSTSRLDQRVLLGSARPDMPVQLHGP